MPDVNVYEAFKELIQKLFSGDEEIAELAAKDPEGLLAAYGITEGDLDGVDFRQVVDDCYHDYELPEGSKQGLQSYVAGEPAPSHYHVKEPPHPNGHQTPEQAVQHLQYVTYATYEEHEYIKQEIVQRQLLIDNSDNRVFNIDNSTDVAVDISGDHDGDITVAPTVATTAGDGGIVNTGDDNIITQADGDGDTLVAAPGGELNAATGDGAIQADRIDSVNTGEFAGVQAGRDVENPVVGDGDQSSTAIDGNVSASAVSSGGDADNSLDAAAARARSLTEQRAQEAQLEEIDQGPEAQEAELVEFATVEEAATDDGSGTVEDLVEATASGSEDTLVEQLGA